ncbi:hypothetical protein OF83DRAFT_1260085 [Amylostereum chailletii]|nr:hypothetical protein OF83DRAFT_1260085 [Amylostereum chailletii]
MSSGDDTDLGVRLPNSWQSWKDINKMSPEWCQPWETLRPFFLSHGYDLYKYDQKTMANPTSNRLGSPALDSFGLYGDRGEGFKCYMARVTVVFGARDRLNRDVVIKVVSKGEENIHEFDILQLLNSEPLKSDPVNTTVPILEFIQFQDWTFAVMPYCDDSFDPPMLNAEECLDFSEQLLTVRPIHCRQPTKRLLTGRLTLQGLSFLHKNRIAHLVPSTPFPGERSFTHEFEQDISYENILINHHGKIPPAYSWVSPQQIGQIWPPPEFRSTFPVRYLITDFGYSHRFPLSLPLTKCWMDPMDDKHGREHGREHKAPEVSHTRFDPFAADVYQTARLFYSWFYYITPNIPGYLELLQDMTSFYPPDRPSAAASLERLRRLRTQLPEEKRFELVDGLEPGNWWPIVQRPFWRTLREIFLTRGFSIAAQYMLVIAKDHLTSLSRRLVGIITSNVSLK